MRSYRTTVPGTVLVVGLVVAACGSDAGNDGSSAAGEQITIAFESYNYGTDGVGGEGTQQLIDAFEAEHPNIRIDPTGTPAGEIHSSVHAQAAAGDPPDVAQIGWSKFGFVQENLPYVPFEQVAPAGELQAHLDGMYPAAAELGRHDGELAGMAYSVSTPTMFVNADLFAQAGLDAQSPPTTWAEVRDAARAIVDTGAQGVYVDAAGEAKSDFLTQSLINSNGGRLLGDDGSLQLDQSPAVGALSMLGDLSVDGLQPPVGEAEAIAMFEAGRLGMLVSSTALLGGLAASTDGVFDLETAGLPAFDGHDVAPTVSGAGLFVFSDDEAEQQAAWEFVQFLTSARGFTILASEIGYLPLRPALIDDPEYLGDFFAEDDRLLPTVEQLDSLRPYQVLPGESGQQALELMQDQAVAPIMLSGADPEPTLATVAEQMRELLEP
ncbi:carbohydrate ABC transporter substrate-binding protein (CUT1 family) [Haloactinopolyspora alba]|uniref:Carbohydrate ABC transporter substrate-binding protein (CUT1 family) n=1 Tax=Haloactinopolyspora alba TaxID=648780 RepID=A0A2P8E8Z2_9ACTN|nr:ABC transporter substrate-binding protein [Haloactinopolyspora alba]PSL05939.1 carbohydrate ABC transporter substrate-binding protein (CUT1 family) [Haloactinopolyspora alba]